LTLKKLLYFHPCLHTYLVLYNLLILLEIEMALYIILHIILFLIDDWLTVSVFSVACNVCLQFIFVLFKFIRITIWEIVLQYTYHGEFVSWYASNSKFASYDWCNWSKFKLCSRVRTCYVDIDNILYIIWARERAR
jgi:hypothetical protein